MADTDFFSLIAPFLARRASDFALRDSHPHRIIRDRPEPITQLHARLAAVYERSIYGKPVALAGWTRDIIVESLKALPRMPSLAVVNALAACLTSLMDENEIAFAFPGLDRALVDNANYALPLRRRLEYLEPILAYQDQILGTFDYVASATLAALGKDYLPDTAFADDDDEQADQADFTVPLLTLVKRPKELVEKLIATFLSDEEHNTTEPYRFAFWKTRNQLFENLLAASGTTIEQLERNPHKLVLPGKSGLALEEMAAAYLAGTPFLPLLQMPVPFRLTARFAHHHIVATPGAGKTNLISFLVSKDLDEVARGAASVIVLDSQGDLIHSIVRIKDFAPGGRLHERLVYIDPTDIEHPLELNIFARRGDRALSPLAKRTEHAQLVDLLLFLFGALRQEATGRQETLIKAVASLIQEIPDVTLMTLNAIFAPPQRGRPSLEPFREPLARLDPAIQDFFAIDFASTEFSQSRAQLRARVHSLINDPVFRAMFGATEQKLDFAAEMGGGKVILINAYEDLLKTGTEVFGRFFIALAAQAAQARQSIPEARRTPTYFYIDECYKFIKDDTNVETILDTGRKYRLGIVLAHQRLNQLSDALKSAASGAAIKMVRAPIHEDARTLASQLNATPDYFDALPEHAFATRIAGMREPVALAIPLSPLATAEHMTDAEFAEVRNVMRRKYARAEAHSPAASSPATGASDASLSESARAFPADPTPASRTDAATEPLVKPGKDW